MRRNVRKSRDSYTEVMNISDRSLLTTNKFKVFIVSKVRRRANGTNLFGVRFNCYTFPIDVNDKQHTCSLSSSYFMKYNVILYVFEIIKL